MLQAKQVKLSNLLPASANRSPLRPSVEFGRIGEALDSVQRNIMDYLSDGISPRKPAKSGALVILCGRRRDTMPAKFGATPGTFGYEIIANRKLGQWYTYLINKE